MAENTSTSEIKKPQMPPPQLSDFFKNLTSDEDSEEIIAQCILCQEKINIIEEELGVTTYFVNHLKEKHAEKLAMCINRQFNDTSTVNNDISCDNIFDGFFEKQTTTEEKSVSKIVAKCLLCTDKNTIIQGAPGVTSNFITHFKRKHPQEYEIYAICSSKTPTINYEAADTSATSHSITKNRLFDDVFERLNCETPVEKLVAKCLLCTHKETIIQGTANVTSNFIRHLQRMHPQNYEQYIDKKMVTSIKRQTYVDIVSPKEEVKGNGKTNKKELFKDFFEKIEQTIAGKVIAKCLLCTDKFITVQGTLNVTSNFIRHLKRAHPMNYAVYLRGKNKHMTLDIKAKLNELEIMHSSGEKSLQQEPLSNVKTMRKSLFVDIFEKQYSEADKLVAKCLICASQIRGATGSTSNFLTHFRRAHTTQYEEYMTGNGKNSNFQANNQLLPFRKNSNLRLFVDFFQRQDCESGKQIAKCLLCTGQDVFIHGSAGVSSNFLAHLRRKHTAEYEEYTGTKIPANGSNNSPSKTRLIDVFFEKQHYESADNKLLAKCLLCTHKTTIIQGYHKIYSNFNRHLKIKHTAQYEEYLAKHTTPMLANKVENCSSNEMLSNDDDEFNQTSFSHDFLENESMDSEDIPAIEMFNIKSDSLQEVKRTTKEEPSEKETLFEFFEELKSKEYSYKLMAKCLICTDEETIIQGYPNDTSNFIEHLKNLHPHQHEEYLKKKSHNLSIDEPEDSFCADDSNEALKEQSFSYDFSPFTEINGENSTAIDTLKNEINALANDHPQLKLSFDNSPCKKALFNGIFQKLKSQSSSNQLIAKCLLCTNKNKIIRGYPKVTSNFIGHFKRAHPEQYEEYLMNKARKRAYDNGQDMPTFEDIKPTTRNENVNDKSFYRSVYGGDQDTDDESTGTIVSSKDKIIAKCLLCTDKETIIKAPPNVSSNLLRHLKRKHPTDYDEYLIARIGTMKKPLFDGYFTKLGVTNRKNSEILDPFAVNKRRRLSVDTAEQEEFTEDIANFILESGLSVDIVDNPFFQNLFTNRTNLEIPSANEVMEILNNR